MRYLTYVCALTPPTLHKNLAEVKPDPDPVLFLFQFTPCQTQNCYAGEACGHMCFVLLSVLFSSTGTDSSELLTSLGVDTASIE